MAVITYPWKVYITCGAAGAMVHLVRRRMYLLPRLDLQSGMLVARESLRDSNTLE